MGKRLNGLDKRSILLPISSIEAAMSYQLAKLNLYSALSLGF